MRQIWLSYCLLNPVEMNTREFIVRLFLLFSITPIKKKSQQTPAMALSKHSTCTNSGVDISGMTFYTRQTNYLVQAPNFTNSPN